MRRAIGSAARSGPGRSERKDRDVDANERKHLERRPRSYRFLFYMSPVLCVLGCFQRLSRGMPSTEATTAA
jgi:hypothetical protein